MLCFTKIHFDLSIWRNRLNTTKPFVFDTNMFMFTHSCRKSNSGCIQYLVISDVWQMTKILTFPIQCFLLFNETDIILIITCSLQIKISMSTILWLFRLRIMRQCAIVAIPFISFSVDIWCHIPYLQRLGLYVWLNSTFIQLFTNFFKVLKSDPTNISNRFGSLMIFVLNLYF